MQPFLNPLTQEKEKEYLQKSADGDAKARHLLIEHNLRLIAHIVKKYSSSITEQEDLMSAGTIGLCKAVDTYDIKKGNRLVTYASRCIENEILMLLRQEKKMIRETSLFEPLGKDKDGNEMDLIDVMQAPGNSIDEELFFRQEIQKVYSVIQKSLNSRERILLTMRFGLDGNRCRTQKEVGEYFGISRSYVSRLEKKILLKLRKEYEKK